MTGEGEDSPQSSEEVANQVGKQRVQIIWKEEAEKNTKQDPQVYLHEEKIFYRKGLWDKIQMLSGGFWEKDSVSGYLSEVLVQ